MASTSAAGYNFRIYDYTDVNNNYGVQTGWFGSSGYDPTVVSFTAVPEPATWALMTLGFVVVGGAAYASRRRQAVAAV
jgi:PEP-CTERM motif